MNEALDLRKATKIEVTTTMICPRLGGCPIMHIYNAIIGMNDYKMAVRIADEEPETKTEKINADETLIVCQVKREDDSPCGGMIIRKSLLEREPLLRYTAKRVITREGAIVENPNFGGMN